MAINMTTPSEQTILALAQHFTPLAGKLSHQWKLDVDDVKQDIVEIIMTTLPQIPDQSRDVKPYLHRVITTRFLALHSEKYAHKPAHILSLDAPLPDNPEATRADMLAAPSGVPTDDTLQVEREQALYAALHRLRCEEQAYLRRVYKLNAFKVERRIQARQRVLKGKRSITSIRQNAYYKLRHDAELASCYQMNCSLA